MLTGAGSQPTSTAHGVGVPAAGTGTPSRAEATAGRHERCAHGCATSAESRSLTIVATPSTVISGARLLWPVVNPRGRERHHSAGCPAGRAPQIHPGHLQLMGQLEPPPRARSPPATAHRQPLHVRAVRRGRDGEVVQPRQHRRHDLDDHPAALPAPASIGQPARREPTTVWSPLGACATTARRA
jgi:hypothetical protein